jgi:putative endonuclease
MDGAYLYILRCADGSYYTGTARAGVEKRVAEHNSATYGGYTGATPAGDVGLLAMV